MALPGDVERSVAASVRAVVDAWAATADANGTVPPALSLAVSSLGQAVFPVVGLTERSALMVNEYNKDFITAILLLQDLAARSGVRITAAALVAEVYEERRRRGL